MRLECVQTLLRGYAVMHNMRFEGFQTLLRGYAVMHNMTEEKYVIENYTDELAGAHATLFGIGGGRVKDTGVLPTGSGEPAEDGLAIIGEKPSVPHVREDTFLWSTPGGHNL